MERVHPEFHKQAKRLDYYVTADDHNLPRPSGVELIQPSMSYQTHMRLAKTRVLAFGKPKVDLCDKCELYAKNCGLAKTALEYQKIADEWNKHKLEADASYHILKLDEDECRSSWAALEASMGAK